MDIVTDLTSQTVSFIGIVQDICKKHIENIDERNNSFEYFYKVAKGMRKLAEAWKDDEDKCQPELKQISELIWISSGEQFNIGAVDHFIDCALELLGWFDDHNEALETHFKERTEEYFNGLNSSPYQWRESLRYILYKMPDERKRLVTIIHYIPLQMVLVVGGGALSEYDTSLYQVWEAGNKLNITSEKDREKSKKWWAGTYKGKERKQRLFELLCDDKRLAEELNEENIPVPFETILLDELSEIEESRKLRCEKDNYRYPETRLARKLAGKGAIPLDVNTADPLGKARSMDLYGLTFSGGGIRSATFNLGILQNLADSGLLRRFDYLSTVSGGGYVGSWFEAWVLRARSVEKINDRLNTTKSADPLAEEVRPIRWLRMFSNYLAPNKSIMSADSWTMGVTWLRNTIINQLILILLLCSALWLVRFFFELWGYFVAEYSEASPVTANSGGPMLSADWKIFLYSCLVFVPAACFAGMGMRVYSDSGDKRSAFDRRHNANFAFLLIGWGLLTSFILSLWFFRNKPHVEAWWPTVVQLWPAGVAGFLALLAVAWMGKYGYKTGNSTGRKFYLQFLVFISSAAAAFGGLLLLAVSWRIIHSLRVHVPAGHKHDPHYTNASRVGYIFGYIVGLPLITEVITVIVVIRMALLGNIFPDERREWWGRVGAIAHRFMFLWIVAIVVIMYLSYLVENDACMIENLSVKALTALGGWSAVIGYALKTAFGAKTSGDKETKGSSKASEILVLAAPYLFAIGIVVISSYFIDQVTIYIVHHQGYKGHLPRLTICLALGIIVGGITVFISQRIGVNEFSLHNFYRNRLVRAYLGASKTRKDREKTVNSFTGFNNTDDLNLSDLKAGEYTGPYPILNATLNVTEVVAGELDRQDRKAESFVFTPKYCGFDFSRTRPASRSAKKSYDYGYRPTGEYSGPDGPTLGTAMAISGAAVNPNQGYHSSSATAFLLTVFNLRLGRWMGNPRKSHWRESDPQFGLGYLISDLIGISDASSNFVCLSDGGHFDNMGLYELVRRRCRHIMVCDAEEDVNSTCEGFANAIRRCRIDFGVKIDINVADITNKDSKTGFSKKHWVTGSIWYPDDPVCQPSGTLVYVKTSLTEDLTSVDVREYYLTNDAFPQQSTGDQFFDESQFESYRALGYASIAEDDCKKRGRGRNSLSQ